MVLGPQLTDELAGIVRERIKTLLGKARAEEEILGYNLAIYYHLESGFIIVGRSATLYGESFDIDASRMRARQDAENGLWALESYLLLNERKTKGEVEDKD